MTGTREPLVARQLPPRSSAAVRVLTMVDDPNVGVPHLAATIGGDPAMAMRIMALANSAYYGLSGRVGTLPYAVSVLGFQTVRAVAVSFAAGLDDPSAVPQGFWEQAAVAATAAGVVAPVLGASAPDAFCVALLHTLGSALLHQLRPIERLCLPLSEDDGHLLDNEVEVYSISHAEYGAEVLASWHLPPALCDLVAGHHEPPLASASELQRTLSAARVIADVVLRRHDNGARERAGVTLHWLSRAAITAEMLEPMLARVAEQSTSLRAGLQAA